MPYSTIAAAKEAGFPTSADDIPLTLAQINKLAKIYDAIKAAGGAENPMAVTWSQWKKLYKKEGGSWITAEIVQAELIGAEVSADSYDAKTHIVKAIRVGTIGHYAHDNSPFECTVEWLTEHANDWTGGKLIANHYGAASTPYGDIIRSWFDDDFVSMELSDIEQETERRMLANEHTGFSFDASGTVGAPDVMSGTNLSILFYPHRPACSVQDGCGLTAEELAESKNNVSQSLVDKNSIANHRGDVMAGEKTLTDKEIETLKAEAAEGATRLAAVERLEGEVSTRDATIKAKDVEIEKQTGAMAAMFTAEDVEAKVVEAKATMFSAEDIETAKKEAVEAALVIEKEKVDRIAAELDAITKMFPEGLDETFRGSIVAMVKDGKSHEALVELGKIEYTTLKANVPTGTGTGTEPNERDMVEADVCGVGVYDPVTRTYSSEVA